MGTFYIGLSYDYHDFEDYPKGIYYGKNDAKNIRKRELRVRDDTIFDLENDNRCKNNRFLRQKRKKNEK